MGFYSNTVKSLETVPEGAKAAISNAPTNGGRVLILLKASGLIAPRAVATGNAATPADITVNPKDLKVVEWEAAQLLRRIDDVDFACIPMNCIISGKFSPEKQGFCFEDRPLPSMVIVARPDNAKSADVEAFVKACQSPEAKDFIARTENLQWCGKGGLARNVRTR